MPYFLPLTLRIQHCAVVTLYSTTNCIVKIRVLILISKRQCYSVLFCEFALYMYQGVFRHGKKSHTVLPYIQFQYSLYKVLHSQKIIETYNF